MIFKWKDSYSVNIAEIDKQHKKLFEIGARIYDVANLNDDYDHYDEIMEIMGELKDYTVYHFGYEEKLMAEHGYSDLDTHQVQHKFFIKRLEKILKKDIDDQQQETVGELLNFIADWIAGHILQTDMKYKDFLNAKGIY